MRRIILLNTILLLSSMWAVAQNDSDSARESKALSVKMTIQGCEDGAIGNYTLTDNMGITYRLTGDPEELKAYVGGTLLVTGVLTPVVNVPGSMSEGHETQPTLAVISLKQVSAVCNNTNY